MFVIYLANKEAKCNMPGGMALNFQSCLRAYCFPVNIKQFLRNNWMRLLRLRLCPVWYGPVRLLQATA